MMKNTFQGLNTTLIHQLKKKIEELNEERERYTELFEQSNDGIILLDFNGKIFGVNNKIKEITDYSEKELLGTRIWQLIPKSEKKIVGESFRRVLKNKSEFVESKLLKKDGRIVEISVYAKVITLKEGSFVQAILRDITEKKKAEEVLKESEEKFRAIIDNSTDQIFMLDKNYKFQAINKIAAGLSRKTPEEIIGKSISKIFPKETAMQFTKNNAEVFKTGKSKAAEEKMIVQGREFWNSTILNPIKDDKGKVIAVAGIVRDITERKKIENVLEESKAFTESTLNSITDIFYSFDLRGKFLSWNKTFKRISGYSDKELSLKKSIDFFLGKDIQHIAEAVKKIYKEGTSTVNANFVLKDGRQIPYEFTGSVLKGNKGNIIGFSGTGRDITEKKKAEKVLRESEEKFRAIFENAGEGILIADAKTKKFIFANPKICKILGYKEKALLKLKVDDIHPKKDLPHVMEQFKKQLQKKILTSNLPVLRKDRKVIFCDITATPLIINGKECLAGFFLEK